MSVTENDYGQVAAFSASSQADRTGVHWSLAGWDETHFSIDAPPGVLRLRPDADTAAGLWRAAADFEDPRDAGGDNTYDVVVVASAPGGASVAHRRHRHGDSRAGTADTDMIRCLTGWRACRQFGGNRAP